MDFLCLSTIVFCTGRPVRCGTNLSTEALSQLICVYVNSRVSPWICYLMLRSHGFQYTHTHLSFSRSRLGAELRRIGTGRRMIPTESSSRSCSRSQVIVQSLALHFVVRVTLYVCMCVCVYRGRLAPKASYWRFCEPAGQERHSRSRKLSIARRAGLDGRNAGGPKSDAHHIRRWLARRWAARATSSHGCCQLEGRTYTSQPACCRLYS